MESFQWDNKVDYPNLFLRYGSEEPFFLKEDGTLLYDKSIEFNFQTDIKEFQGGHNHNKWN